MYIEKEKTARNHMTMITKICSIHCHYS